MTLVVDENGNVAGERAPDSLTAVEVIVVEDEAALRGDLVDFLNERGVRSIGVSDGGGLVSAMATNPPSVLIVDIILPGVDGLTLIDHVRGQGFDGGVIVLSALDGADTMVTGYANGADVYLTKRTELVVVEACARRLIANVNAKRGVTAFSEVGENDTAAWRLDPVRRLLWFGEGACVKLTGRELSVLGPLMTEPGRGVPRETLAAATHRLTVDEERRVDAVVSRLRRKVRAELGREAPIDHVYGVGYAFTDLASILSPSD